MTATHTVNIVEKPKKLNDPSKFLLACAKYMLDTVNLWPEKQNVLTNGSSYVMLFIFGYLEFGQIVHLITSSDNIAGLVEVFSNLSVALQAVTKLSIIFINYKELDSMIKLVWEEFWPSNVMGKKSQRAIIKPVNIVLTVSYCVYISGMLFSFGFLSAPYLSGKRVLPYRLWYPFDWQSSPTYELLYILHAFINMFLILNTICGYDFLFFAMCLNVTTQFQLLGQAISKFGSDEEKEVCDKLHQFKGVAYKRVLSFEAEEERKLLMVCIRHHQKLIRICNQLNSIFTFGHFVQLSTSVTAICVSCFLITLVEINKNEQSAIISFCFGHVVQLFLLCAVSNEVSHWSTVMGSSINESCWYFKNKKSMEKYLIMVSMRSQMGNHITAMGMLRLNYATFTQVMRFSFSIYTLMGQIVD